MAVHLTCELKQLLSIVHLQPVSLEVHWTGIIFWKVQGHSVKYCEYVM